MTTVRFVDAARYAVKLFAYLLAVVLVATGAVSLGYWIAIPEVSPALGAGTAEMAPLVGGAVLILVGLVVFWIGTLSATYKMIADAVTVGRENVAGAVTSEAATASGDTTVADPGGPPEDSDAGATDSEVAAAAREGARAAQAAAEPPSTGQAAAESTGEPTAESTTAEARAAEPTTGATTAAEAGGSVEATAGETQEPPSAPAGTNSASTTETGAEAAASTDAGNDGGSAAIVDTGPAGEPDRETNPDPPDEEETAEPEWETKAETHDRETTPEPEWETTPEPSERETTPEPHDRETNPNPPDSGHQADESRPEPSAEEIAFGSSGGTGDGDATEVGDDASGSAAEEAAEGGLDDAWESLDPDDQPDPMWGESTEGTGGTEEDEGGFEEASIEEDVEAVETESGEDPLG